MLWPVPDQNIEKQHLVVSRLRSRPGRYKMLWWVPNQSIHHLVILELATAWFNTICCVFTFMLVDKISKKYISVNLSINFKNGWYKKKGAAKRTPIKALDFPYRKFKPLIMDPGATSYLRPYSQGGSNLLFCPQVRSGNLGFSRRENSTLESFEFPWVTAIMLWNPYGRSACHALI